jgi:geranylgeranyl pyrophosphate synthase
MTTDLRTLKATIEDALNHHLPHQSPIAQPLVDAMRYATLSGGKRLRPMLTCASCIAVGGAMEDALAPACAVEFIHAYSLIHDDLPAMDNDSLRHGLPSNHIQFGEGNAILAGDALQALAFRTLADATNVAARTRLQSVALLSEAAGWQGMVGGQHLDLAAEQQSLPLEHLEALHLAKTGALIRAAVQIGALVGDPDLPDESFVLLSEFAGRLGLAFQVMDDVLDATGSTETLGKPAGSDANAEKSTYVKLLGIERSRALAGSLLKEARAFLSRANLQDTLLIELSDRSINREF